MSRGVAYAAGLALAVGIVVGAVVVAVGLLGGSGGGDDPRSGLDADTARFTYGDRTAVVELLECALDGETFVAAGRRGAMVLQVGVDLGDGGAARSGVTMDIGDDGLFGAFGGDLPQGPVGELTSIERLGDSVVVQADWAVLDPDTLAPVGGPDAAPVPGELVARCPETDPPAD
jgi:hypothetical protein